MKNLYKKKILQIIKEKSKIDIILNCAAISIFTHFEKEHRKS